MILPTSGEKQGIKGDTKRDNQVILKSTVKAPFYMKKRKKKTSKNKAILKIKRKKKSLSLISDII